MADTISEAIRSLPPGFRFHCTDEELLNHYLKPKILGQPDKEFYDILPEIDVCECEPRQLPIIVGNTFNSKELIFYCCVKRKYSNSKRCDRTTKAGYWKVTGKERAIMSEDTNAQIGIKKTLVFYEGSVPKGKRTNWIMHEYNLNPQCLGNYHNDQMLPYVVCRVKNKKDKKLMKGGPALTFSPEGYSISPYTSTGSVAENPMNQEGDYPSFCSTPINEAADYPEVVDAQPKLSEEELLELLPPLETLDDYLSEYNTPIDQPQAGAEEGPSSFYDFSINDSSNEFDYGYMPSPNDMFKNYSGLGWSYI